MQGHFEKTQSFPSRSVAAGASVKKQGRAVANSFSNNYGITPSPLSKLGKTVQLMQIRHMGKVVWDTDWTEDEKRRHANTLNEPQKKKIRAELGENHGDLGFINQHVEEKVKPQIPRSDTSGSKPHGKTPKAQTKTIHMNYHLRDGRERIDTEYAHLLFFIEQSKALGLHLEIFTNKTGKEDVEKDPNILEGLSHNFNISANDVSEWAEDSVEFLQNGILAVLPVFSDSAIEDGIDIGRKKRWDVPKEFEKEAFGDNPEWIRKGTKVNKGNTGKLREQEQLSKGKKVGHIRAYIEGGNMITGEDADGKPLILVGRDAIAATANVYQIAEEDVRSIIMEDFGLKERAQVVFVEQPGKFHLDMGLLMIGNGLVIVNDSTEKLRTAKQKLEECDMGPRKKIVAELDLICRLESMAVEDLSKNNLKVVRKKLEDGTNYNFFNGEFVTDRAGNHFYLTNGGAEDKQDAFRKWMVEELQVVKDVRFSPSSAASKSLTEQGGVGCRIKGAPNFI